MTYTDEEHIHEGWATNKYYYVNDKGERTPLVPGKMVHGPSSGRELAGKTVEYFFIGSSDQFHKDEYVPNEYEVN
ncbi:hypothetical protein KDJ21_022760 [Metabacillus litoralis]|nr:hypothetical protein [Metabacillus litoralis]UHA59563.1 hypothetical protein KDJ21_022760 [Metabacillus litoralis]